MKLSALLPGFVLFPFSAQANPACVVCSIADMGSDVFRMELAMPDKLTAEMIKNNFIAHGSDIFPKLLNALTQPGSEADRPPAGLM